MNTQELTISEKKARYKQSALKQLMDAAEHEICERCYCCDVVWEHGPCWQCGGFEEADDPEWPEDVCSVCHGEGELTWKACIGRCDENGNHAHEVGR